jgi:hypothetical protein
VKSKKPHRRPPSARRRSPAVDEASFTVVLEDLHAKFDAFGEALWIVRDDVGRLRTEMHAMRDELRGEMHGIRDELRGEMHGIRDELRGEMHGIRDELRGEIHGVRDDLRAEIGFVKTAVLELSKRSQ